MVYEKEEQVIFFLFKGFIIYHIIFKIVGNIVGCGNIFWFFYQWEIHLFALKKIKPKTELNGKLNIIPAINSCRNMVS